MDQLLPSASFDWLPVVALLCAGSVAFLAISAFKFFASRRRNAAVAERVPMAEPIDAADSATPSLEPTREVESTPADLDLPTWSAPTLPAESPGAPPYECTVEDQQPNAAERAISLLYASHFANVREAVRARVTRDRTSAHGLSDLVRALYLDQSNFRFQVLAELQPEDRALARVLIEQWLANPSALEYWEGIYADIREAPDALRDQA